MTKKFFDPDYYLQQNPDVAASSKWSSNPAGHYQRFGRFEGRNPNEFYDEQFYLAHNTDVARAVARGDFASGYDHWIAYGQFEDRSPLEVLGTQYYWVGQEYYFRSASAYFSANPDVLAAYLAGTVQSAWQHYVQYGYKEGRTSALGVIAHGSERDDTFNLQGNIQWTVRTGAGNDIISVKEHFGIGSYITSNNIIDAGDGNDVVDGGIGMDIIIGGGGNDILYGGDAIYYYEDHFLFGIPSLAYEYDIVGNARGESFDTRDRLVLPTGVAQSNVLTFSDGEDWHVRYTVAGHVQEIELDFRAGQAPAQFDSNWLIFT